MNLSYFGDICKPAYVLMLGLQQNFKETRTRQCINRSVCEKRNCPLFKMMNATELTPKQAQDVLDCCSRCAFATSEVTEVVADKEESVYINEHNKYNPSKKAHARFSKSQLKQFILYHFLVKGSLGIAFNVSEKQVAQLINCTTRTVRDNNKFFERHHYISLSPGLDKGCFTVLIKDYSDKHKTAQQGGRGYLSIPQETLHKILAIKDVNELRLSLRMLFYSDDVKNTQGASVVKDVASFKRMLPDYISKPQILFMLDKQQEMGLFSVSKKERKEVEYMLFEEYNPVLKKNQLLNAFEEQFVAYAEDNEVELDGQLSQDLAQMGLQYSYDVVKLTFDAIMDKVQAGAVRNIGGYIRAIINKHLMYLNHLDVYVQILSSKHALDDAEQFELLA